MSEKDLLSRLNAYLRNIAKSGDFDKFFSAAINESYKNIVFQAIRTSKYVNEDVDDVVQHLIVNLWGSLLGFCDNHLVNEGKIYTIHKVTSEGYYMKHKKEVFLFQSNELKPLTYKLYLSVFFNKLNQLCATYVNFLSREKRGLKVEHVYLQDYVAIGDDFSCPIEEMINSQVESPEDAFEFKKLKELIGKDLSNYATIYFEAVGFLPTGPLEGWKRPLKMYMRELLQARAELYRAYNKKVKGFDPSIITDEIIEGVKDPLGFVDHRPIHVSAGVLKR